MPKGLADPSSRVRLRLAAPTYMLCVSRPRLNLKECAPLPTAKTCTGGAEADGLGPSELTTLTTAVAQARKRQRSAGTRIEGPEVLRFII
jgi:hypothetical protein